MTTPDKTKTKTKTTSKPPTPTPSAAPENAAAGDNSNSRPTPVVRLADPIETIAGEWDGLEPSEKDMGMVQFVLDKGVKTTVVGTVYGLDFHLEGEGYTVNVFFDYYNRRLKIVDYDATDYTAMIARLAWLAEANSFDKVFVKATSEDFQKFLSHGYMMEGVLRYYFRGRDAYVLSRFSSITRAQNKDLVEEARLIEDLIYHSKPTSDIRPLPEGVELIHATEEHIPALVAIYRSVFETYPSPLTSADFVKSTMERDVHYCLAVRAGEALAVASADVNAKHSNAEMTDCATFPAARGQGLMQHILNALEDQLRERGIITAYTLARAGSIGMNRVFFRLGYEFSGRLINNCDIFGQYEDMNIWVKRLQKAR